MKVLLFLFISMVGGCVFSNLLEAGTEAGAPAFPCGEMAQKAVVKQAEIDSPYRGYARIAGVPETVTLNSEAVTYEIALFQATADGEKGCGTGEAYNVTLDLQNCELMGAPTPAPF